MLESIKSSIKTRLKDDITRRIATASGWSLLGSIFSRILVIVTVMIVTRILTVDEYGQVGLIRSTIIMFVNLAAIGMGTTASKFIAEYRKSQQYNALKIYLTSNIFALFMATIAMITVYACANIIAETSLHDINLAKDIRIGSFMVFFCIMNGAQYGVLQGFEDFKSIAKVNVVTALAESIFVVMGAYWGNVTGSIIGYTISFLITTFTYSFFIRKRVCSIDESLKDVVRNLTFNDFKFIIKFGLPLAIQSMITVPVIWWIKSYLVKVSGYEQMAFFDVADQWYNQVLYIPTILTGIILPILSNVNAESRNDFWRVVKINLTINTIVAFVVSLVLILFGELILSAYGKNYVDAYWILTARLACAVLVTISNITVPILVAKNCVTQGIYFNIILSICLISLGVYFINLGAGALGLSVAILISYLILLAVEFSYIYFKKSKWDLKTS